MNTRDLIIFYGRNAALARELGVPIFLDGDTGQVVKTTPGQVGCDLRGAHSSTSIADIWTGRYPGFAECEEFGWWVYSGPDHGKQLGWVRCGPNHPGASHDLNRLQVEGVWDADLKRWTRP